jgi:hypothetical protein
MTPKEFFDFAKKQKALMVDLKFTDLLGTWQHCSFPITTWDEGTFEDGVGFDGSSIRGWQKINVSDMLAIPDADTTVMDPFYKEPTVSVIANIVDPETREDYSRDPRHIARKATEYLKKTKIADTCHVGPEPEFFIFNEVRFEQNQHKGYYEIDSDEGAWNTGRFEEPNLGYKPSYKGGYFPVSPTDTFHDLRGEMVYEMMKIGIIVEAHHHEVATAGQSEIDMRFAPLLQMADQFMWYKYIIKNVAKRHGKTVTFMPKPLFEDNGSGMHTHMSLWKGGKPLFAGKGYAGLSDLALNAARADGVRGAHRELVSPAGARVRGARQPRHVQAESLGVVPDPDVLAEPEGEARGVPLPGPDLQRLPDVLRDADGDDRRHPDQGGSGETARPRHLRDDSSGARQDEEDAGFALGVARRAQARPQVPAQGRRLHGRPDRDLDRLQDRERAGAAGPAAPPVRVPLVL